MKGDGGATGLFDNDEALQRLCIVTPEIVRLNAVFEKCMIIYILISILSL